MGGFQSGIKRAIRGAVSNFAVHSTVRGFKTVHAERRSFNPDRVGPSREKRERRL